MKVFTLICKIPFTQAKLAIVEIVFAWLTCNSVWEHPAYWFRLSSGKGQDFFSSP